MNVLITGANSGIGFETAKQLLQKGQRVHVVCRDEKKTQETVALLQEFGQVFAAGKQLDLDDLDSVRRFCSNEFQLDSFNVLICNAGVMGKPKLTLTKQGFEAHVGVNYLAHFLLTRLLLKKLELGARVSGMPSRVINVSGEAYVWAQGMVNISRAFNGVTANDYSFPVQYAHSKLFQIWDSETLTEQYPNGEVVSMALHPGVIHTNLMRNIKPSTVELLLGASPDMLKTVEQGAMTTVYCATSTLQELGISPGKDKKKQYYYVDSARALDLVEEMLDVVPEQRRELERISKLHCGLEQVLLLDILITGANSGIGYEAARQLLEAGHRVHVVCRDEAKTDETVKLLSSFGKVFKAGKSLNLEDLHSVQRFCQEDLRLKALNVLICNAGVMGLPELQFTKQGCEAHLGINYLSHYLLTRLLISKLQLGAKQSGVPSRIVNVSSMAYTWARDVDFTQAFSGGSKDEYSFQLHYAYSKLFQIWDAATLNQQLRPQVLSVSLHPGVVRTNIARSMDPSVAELLVSDSSTKSASEGAATTVFCATASLQDMEITDDEHVFFYQDCKRVHRMSKLVKDDAKRRELAHLSEEFCRNNKSKL